MRLIQFQLMKRLNMECEIKFKKLIPSQKTLSHFGRIHSASLFYQNFINWDTRKIYSQILLKSTCKTYFYTRNSKILNLSDLNGGHSFFELLFGLCNRVLKVKQKISPISIKMVPKKRKFYARLISSSSFFL